jgi:hypothetical protein
MRKRITKWENEKMRKWERQIRISEEDPSIPYDDNNERIIFRNGKTYKQWVQYGFGSHIWFAEKEIASECVNEWIERKKHNKKKVKKQFFY